MSKRRNDALRAWGKAAALCLSFWLATAAMGNLAQAEVYRQVYEAQGLALAVEVLDDDLAHFELSKARPNAASGPIAVTPMIAKQDYAGPKEISRDAQGNIRTSQMLIQVNPSSLAITIFDLKQSPDQALTTLEPLVPREGPLGLVIQRNRFEHVYGLGEHFGPLGQVDGDLAGRARVPGISYGNRQTPYAGGNTGNAQFPVMYALDGRGRNYALFLDEVKAQTWDFSGDPWRVFLDSPSLRWYFMTGPDLPDLRRDYMELVGRPLVPPKKAFGLWVSQYGFRDWAQVQDHLASLREHGFPVDGFVLDLFWFGGIVADSPDSRMGALSWDLAHFPDPEKNLCRLKQDEGVGIMVIEESYVCRNLPAHAELERLGYLVRRPGGKTPCSFSSWWGLGGMLDWTNPQGAAWWHEHKRAPLIRQGVMGHWTDLGEPEDFSPRGVYHGLPGLGTAHAQVCNLYNFLWLQSIHQGYQKQGVKRRPWMLSRSGAPGMQRFGAGMWSGDIACNLESYRSHLNVQTHMSFSGLDYFGSDIGGFWRNRPDGDPKERYTRWFAHGALLDVPLRPHTFNLSQKYETAPDRVGDVASNLANTRLRYRLGPYLYSLAHQAHRLGDPLFPPLVFHYQNDPATRVLASHKMLGRDLLMVAAAQYGQQTARAYLPKGKWTNYHSGREYPSQGQWFDQVPCYYQGRMMAPLFARAGAIIPEMPVDGQTMNILGRRKDGGPRRELVLRIFPGEEPSGFTLYEDDGGTVAYLSGEVRATVITQKARQGAALVSIEPAQGIYQGATEQRNNLVILQDGRKVTQIRLNGAALPRLDSREAFENAARGWHQAPGSAAMAKSGVMPVNAGKAFEFGF